MNPYMIPFAAPKASQNAPKPTMLEKGDLFDEVSSSESLIERAIYPYGANWDPLVRKKGLKIYQEMAQDDQVKACLDLRKQARLSTPWTIASAKDGNKTADMYADFIKHILERMDGTFEDDLYQIYSAVEFGFSVSEMNFFLLPDGPFKGKIGLSSIKTREPFYYDFKTDVFGNLLGLVYNGWLPKSVTDENGGMGTVDNPFPVDKFIIYSYNSKFSNRYGTSDLFAAFRSWQSKRIIMRFWNIWLERYASPFIWATVDPDAALKKNVITEIDDFLRNLSARAGFRCPKGVTLEAIQTSSTAADAFEKSIEAHNRYISHALLCPNLLGITGQQGSGGSGGSYALGKKQFGAFMWVLDRMGRDTSETIVGEQIINRLIRLNFPNVDESMMPRFKFEGVEEDSIEARARIVAILSNAGFIAQEEDWIREFLSLPKKDPKIKLPEVVRGIGGAPGRNGANGKDKEDYAERQMREPQEFEKKVKVLSFKRELDDAQEQMHSELASELEVMREEIIAWVDKKEIFTELDPKALDSLNVNVKGLKDTLRRWLFKAFLDSKLRALEELGRAGVEVDVVRKFERGFAEAAMEPWQPLPPREAVDFFNRKVKATVRNKRGEKVLIEVASGSQIPYYDSRAFAIAGVVRDDILNEARAVLLNGIKRQDEVGAMKDLKNVFNKYLESGIEVDDELLTPHRLNTIVRTNLVEAVNEGRRAMYEDPDLDGFVQYFQYSSIMDDRTTDYCRCMDGKVFRMEDMPILNPPAHFNCRAFTVPVTTFELEDLKKEGRGIKIADPCRDRAEGFSDMPREPVAMPLPVQGEQPEPAGEPGSAVARDSIAEEMRKAIVNCPYSTCRANDIRMVGMKLNVAEFECGTCRLPFRISSHGDLYLWESGIERWERVSYGMFPIYFKKGSPARAVRLVQFAEKAW